MGNEWTQVFEEYEALRNDVDDLIDVLLNMSITGRDEPCWCKRSSPVAAWLHDENCMSIKQLIKNSSISGGERN